MSFIARASCKREKQVHKRTWERTYTNIWDEDCEQETIFEEIKEALEKVTLVNGDSSTSLIVREVYRCEEGVCAEVLFQQKIDGESDDC